MFSSSSSTPSITSIDIILFITSLLFSIILPTYTYHYTLPYFTAFCFFIITISISFHISYLYTLRSQSHNTSLHSKLLSLYEWFSSLSCYLVFPTLTFIYCISSSIHTQPSALPILITSSSLLLLFCTIHYCTDQEYTFHLLYIVILNGSALLAYIIRSLVYITSTQGIEHSTQSGICGIGGCIFLILASITLTIKSKKIRLFSLIVDRNQLFKIFLIISIILIFRSFQVLYSIPVEKPMDIHEMLKSPLIWKDMK